MRTLAALALVFLAARARADDLSARAARAWVVDTSRSTSALAVGERGLLVVAIRCEPGVHVQAQAPLRVAVSASAGLALAKERLGWPDIRGEPASPELEVPFTASAPGAQRARVRLELFLCSREWCVRQDREVALSVEVAGAGPPRRTPPPRPRRRRKPGAVDPGARSLRPASGASPRRRRSAGCSPGAARR